MAPLTIRLLGVELASVGLGLTFLFCGIGGLLGPPVAGLLKEIIIDYFYRVRSPRAKTIAWV